MPSSAIRDALAQLGQPYSGSLSTEGSRAAFEEIIAGDAEPALVAAFLTALRVRNNPFGEESELQGAVEAISSHMIPLEIDESHRPILDTCGTGGDGANTVNISTAVSIVVAACGVRVAKHGNRSASGNSGSSEVMAELGVHVEAEPQVLLRCLSDIGVAFLFAPRFHPAMRHAAAIRRLLPFHTLFNLVGPLVNPARPDFQLIGVPDVDRADLMARAIERIKNSDVRRLKSAYVVAGAAGLDEVGLSGLNVVHTIGANGRKVEYWDATQFGLPFVEPETLRVSGPIESAHRIRSMLAGDLGPVRDIVLANAAAALKLVEKVDSLVEGVARAAEAIDRGDAGRLLERWAAISNS